MRYSYDRTAANPTSLMSAKMAWGKLLAEAAADRFKNYGGWRDFHVKTEIEVVHDTYVLLTVRSDSHAWTGRAAIYLEDTPMVRASINVDKNVGQKVEDIDLLQMLQEVDDESATIHFSDTAPIQKTVEQISLFFSKLVNTIAR